MNPFDTSLFHAINHGAGHTPILDPVMSFFAQYALEIYAVLLLLAWFALPRRDEERRHALVVSVVGAVLGLVAAAVIGTIWVRPRPFMVHGFHDNQIILHAADASFPSDHVTGGFGISAALWGYGPRWLTWLITAVTVIVMFARVYVGVHWPTDVIGGMFIGIICGRGAWVLSRPIRLFTNLGLWMFRMGRFAKGNVRRSRRASR